MNEKIGNYCGTVTHIAPEHFFQWSFPASEKSDVFR